MHPRLIVTIAGLLSPALATLQDLAECDPIDKDSVCPPDLGFATKTAFDFSNSGWDESFEAFWSVDNQTVEDKRQLDFDADQGGVGIAVFEPGQAPTLTSKRYLLFGKVSAEIRGAAGNGVIAALVLKSDSGDEIDWEILGAHDKQAQTNYFYDDKALYNTYNTTYDLDFSVHDDFHKYAVEWTETKVVFSIDDKVVKTMYVGDIPSGSWPQTPMQVKLGTWAVTEDSDAGEVSWAGGVPDWDGDAPFTAYFRKVEVQDYAGWCAEVDGDVKYSYDERMGGWQDIKIGGCAKKMSPGMYTPHVPIQVGPTGASSQQSETGSPSTDDASATATGTSTDAEPSATDGDEAPPQESEDEDDSSVIQRRTSLLLVAVVLLSWLVVL